MADERSLLPPNNREPNLQIPHRARLGVDRALPSSPVRAGSAASRGKDLRSSARVTILSPIVSPPANHVVLGQPQGGHGLFVEPVS